MTAAPAYPAHRFAIAPMMDWTDRHCRYFHRGLTRRALLYTEMITADAVLHGDRERLLGFDEAEHPVAFQVGGSDPAKLAEAAAIAAGFGYDEINLNIGCPSDRVQAGTFGACLMREPALVGRCVEAMKASVAVPVTVKCRLGVDEQDIEAALDAFSDSVAAAGADGLWVHARKAWLKGLSAKENRTLPPLDYDRVYRLKARVAPLFVGLNGGIGNLEQAETHLQVVDGVMLGRAAYRMPAMLADVDRRIYGLSDGPTGEPRLIEAVRRMIPYVQRHCAAGGRVANVTRHMIGLFHGMAGARQWRRVLTEGAARPGAGADVIEQALDACTCARKARPGDRLAAA